MTGDRASGSAGDGPRAKLGVVVLATNRTVEDEFRRMAPPDVSYHVARCAIPDASRDECEKEAQFLALEEGLLAAAAQVAMAKPDVILFACTIGSMLGGSGHDLELAGRIHEATGIPALTTGAAVVEGLRRLGLRKIALISPYPEGMGACEEEYLEAALPGLRVVSQRHLGVLSSYEKNLLPASLAARVARETVTPDADGLFISCTAWPTLDILGVLEEELGRPVVTSTQASLWACLRRCGIEDALPFGRLFEV